MPNIVFLKLDEFLDQDSHVKFGLQDTRNFFGLVEFDFDML